MTDGPRMVLENVVSVWNSVFFHITLKSILELFQVNIKSKNWHDYPEIENKEDFSVKFIF